MRPVPHLERIIDKDDGSRLIVRTNFLTSKPGPRRMSTRILDIAIARLLSTNVVVLTEPPNPQIVGNPEVGNSERERCSLFANWRLGGVAR